MSGFIVNFLDSVPVVGLILGNGYRPPAWSFQPQKVSITANVPQVGVSTVVKTANILSPIEGGIPSDLETITKGAASVPQNNTTSFEQVTYFFDAIFNVHHEQRLTATRHPVQNGASISDHAFIEAARVTLEVQFSDAMDAYISGQYTGFSTKSVSAYQTFLNLRNLRIPMTLQTNLDLYNNMLIEELISDEDESTQFAWKGRLVFKQIFIASVQSNFPNGRPNQITQTAPGASTPQPVPQNIKQNYYNSVKGLWSSNPLSVLLR